VQSDSPRPSALLPGFLLHISEGKHEDFFPCINTYVLNMLDRWGLGLATCYEVGTDQDQPGRCNCFFKYNSYLFGPPRKWAPTVVINL